MDKAMRLEFIRRRFAQLDVLSFTGVLPTGPRDIEEEMSLNDGFREHQRDRATQREALTSDEG
jgi:hypothetical protein